MRDFAIGQTLDIKFNTFRFSSGAPFTLAGSPVVVAYPDNGTTEITAGITLTVDFDARTGLHNVRVVATTGNGYATGVSYSLVLSAGTVDGVSVVGAEIGSFSLGRTSVGAINGVTAAAVNLALSAGVIVVGAAITGTLSTTQMTTNLTEATDDHYNGRRLIWTSGVLLGQATAITDYVGSTKLLTYTATTEAPANTDAFVIV